MLEIIYGRVGNHPAIAQFISALEAIELDGSLYMGYPVLATADDSITVDALLVTMQYGLVGFLFATDAPTTPSDSDAWEFIGDQQDQLFVALENSLRRHESLRAGRQLAITVQTVTVVPDVANVSPSIEGFYCDSNTIASTLRGFSGIDGQIFRSLQAALQRVSTIKPPKRRTNITSVESKGAVIQRIEREIANLDQWQKSAAIESPDGPQRIRGLAGSGKTIVLALKAAYLHSQNPDWTIAVTFWSRSLYQQFEDLVRRFSFEHLNDEPNWQNLRILHAWGGRDRIGLYGQIASHCGVTPRSFIYARDTYGMDNAFEGVCDELLAAIESTDSQPVFDAVLIDEAQDLPIPFFKIVHRMTRDPKRVIWAYDELQNISEHSIPTLEEQFGEDETGEPNVQLVNAQGAPKQDIILPICYRNTPWALSVAHGLGLGTSRPAGLVQSFDAPSLWEDIGYDIVQGTFEKGTEVTLERGSRSYPDYFVNALTPSEAVEVHGFSNEDAQAQWLAQSIRRNLDEDELEHDDILIVLPDAYRARTQARLIQRALQRMRINSHLVGVTSSRDEMFIRDSVAIAHIYRSKGNESPMVYVANAQHCVAGRGLITLRNTLFTAITRSKAWVRLCGWGPRMEELRAEVDSIRNNGYRLRITIPTDEELQKIRRIHREPTSNEQARMNEAMQGLESFISALDRGDISLNDLPTAMRNAVDRLLAGEGNGTPDHVE